MQNHHNENKGMFLGKIFFQENVMMMAKVDIIFGIRLNLVHLFTLKRCLYPTYYYMNNPWDPRIKWSNIVFLMEYKSVRVQHIQWDTRGKDILYLHKFIHEERWSDFLTWKII